MAAFGDFKLGDRNIDAWTPDAFRKYADEYNLGWVICWSPLSRFWFDTYPGARRIGRIPRYATVDRPFSPVQYEGDAIARVAGIEKARQYLLEGDDDYIIYQINRPRSYFLKGKGTLVSVAPDRIELANVVPEDGVADALARRLPG